MSHTPAPKTLREGSTRKRSAILAAAWALFVADGFDRTSVDAIAARAGVSKRTVYDYFGDKQALLLAAVERAGASLMVTVRGAIVDALTDIDDIERALVALSMRIATETFGSADYLAFMRLLAMESVHLPGLRDHWMSNAPEEAIAEHLGVLARAGRIDAPDPRLAADHLVALTLLLAVNKLGPAVATDHARTRRILVDGVRAFLRAYPPRRPAAPRSLA